MVHDPAMGGLRFARTVISMPQPQRWSIERVRQVSVTPWSMHTPEEPGVIHHQPEATPQARGGEGQERLAQVRRLYIRQSDLDQYGYTQNCPRCQHVLVYGAGQVNVNHSEECRNRIMREMSKTPEGQARIQKKMD